MVLGNGLGGFIPDHLGTVCPLGISFLLLAVVYRGSTWKHFHKQSNKGYGKDSFLGQPFGHEKP